MSSWFEVAPQCCDAGSYIQIGRECATQGLCHGDLRPIGNYLWFSIPPRLGLSEDALVVANFLVAAVGILLSFAALTGISARLYQRPLVIWQKVALFFCCLFVHGIFLWPTLFNTLSDPPASMLFLSGVWFILLAHMTKTYAIRALFFLLAGMALGCSAWIRAFNLYPVVAGLAVYVGVWIFSRKKMLMELLILAALLPIGIQFFVIHREYGTYTYLEQTEQDSWMNMHLNQPFVGFDTIFPRNGYFWQPQHCEAQLGILNGLRAWRWNEVACVIAERVYFYLGTYRTKTYQFSSVKNQLLGEYAERIGSRKADWFPQNLAVEEDVAFAPNGQKTADKLMTTSVAADGIGDAVQWVHLRGNTPHTFSVWLWAPRPKTVNLTIKFHADDAPVAVRQFYLSDKPTRYSVTGVTQRDGLYDVDIGRSPYPENAITMGTEAGDFFYAWGAQLEVGEQMTPYVSDEKAQPDSVRIWYPWLLILNLSALMVMVVGIIRQHSFWLGHRAGLCILSMMCMAAIEAVAIIPEQRFGISLMIFIWLMAVTFLGARYSKPVASATQ